ncbi:MAG TPA: glycerophosphodiester phosphodiesterase family protein, partial [Bryobacteraceae bacterium]|nr:glycerophosphodiester phosphodiesterase family protein [Bryobacteraceae bacterium]
PVWISAHRGAMRFAPENTLAAYEKAAELGSNYVEVDVRTTRDGALVIMHDARVDRTTDGRGAVAESTLAEIKRLRPAVPTFAETLRWGKRRGVRIDIDDKAAEIEAIANEIRREGMAERVLIEGPRDRLVRFVGLLPGVDTMPKVTSAADIADAAGSLRMRTVRLSLPQLADPNYVKAARKAGARIAVTILGNRDTEQTMREVIRMGARLIETDYPEVAARVRGL